MTSTSYHLWNKLRGKICTYRISYYSVYKGYPTPKVGTLTVANKKTFNKINYVAIWNKDDKTIICADYEVNIPLSNYLMGIFRTEVKDEVIYPNNNNEQYKFEKPELKYIAKKSVDDFFSVRRSEDPIYLSLIMKIEETYGVNEALTNHES